MMALKNSKNLNLSLNYHLFCTFSPVYDVTYFEIRFNHSKLRKFINS